MKWTRKIFQVWVSQQMRLIMDLSHKNFKRYSLNSYQKRYSNPRATPSTKEETTWQSGYLMIDYISLVPLLTRAIQEQQELINHQEQENLQLEQRVLNLENQFLELLEMMNK